jgi:spore germination protein KC
MKRVLCVLLTFAVLLTITGCWDSKELDTLYFVTGVGLDSSDTDGTIDVNMQIARVTQGSASGSGMQQGSSGGGGGGESSFILLGASGKSVLEALSTLRHESSRTLFLHHNQMIVIGRDLAQKGVQNHLDLFLRDEETRMEALVLVADGKAKDILSAKLNQDKLSGIAVAKMLTQYKTISSHLSVNMLGFISKLLQKTVAPIAPIVEIKKQGDTENLEISKMAVFKGDRMVGELNWDEITGYLWALGEINEGILELSLDKGTAALNIIKANSTATPVLQSDGRYGIIMKIETNLDIEELNGFGQMKLKEIYDLLIQESTKRIEQRVYTTFQKAQQLNSDIYEYSDAFHIKYPKLWKELEKQWETIFPSLQLVLTVNVKLSGTGKTSFSLEMEENKP